MTDRASVLELVDVERMRLVGRVRTSARGAPAAVLWPRHDRLWVVVTGPGATTVVTVDPIARRVLARRRLAGGLTRVAASPDGPVPLLGPSALIGPARLMTVDAAGAVEQVPLDGVSAGLMPTEFAPSVERVRRPALAVDSHGRRAYVPSSRRDWSIRTLDESAAGFVAASGLLLTSGPEGRGLTAGTPDGDERLHLLDSRHVTIVATAGSLAYVRTPPDQALRVVDLARGRVVGTSAPGRATLLLEGATTGRL